jgi:hypothetical protein
MMKKRRLLDRLLSQAATAPFRMHGTTRRRYPKMRRLG